MNAMEEIVNSTLNAWTKSALVGMEFESGKSSPTPNFPDSNLCTW